MRYVRIGIGVVGIAALNVGCFLSSHTLHLVFWPLIVVISGWIGVEWKKGKCVHESCPTCEPEEQVFTGSCPIQERTADRFPVGKCCFATYNHVCHRHGNVTKAIEKYNQTDRLTDENELEKQ